MSPGAAPHRLLPSETSFSTRLRSPAVAARVGVWLGVCFALAFVTGLISHAAQEPSWPFPTRPVWGYRVSQGLHVISGTAAVPLLLVKLWAVFPKLFVRPPRASRELLIHLAERGSIAVLVAAAIFQLATGLANSAQWYPWTFSFRATHYAVGWLAVGALVLHIAVKLPLITGALLGPLDEPTQHGVEPVAQVREGGLSRRALLRTTWAAAGVAVLATAGSTVPALRRVSSLGVRSGGGPGGIPINKTARAAGVTASATSPAYRLTIAYAGREVTLTTAELGELSRHTERLPIACVEGWSASGEWTGVRIRTLLELVEAPIGVAVRVESLQQRGSFRAIELPANFADDPLTLLATGLGGEPLSLDHGYPCRLIAPNRPGVLQTKWVTRLDVLT